MKNLWEYLPPMRADSFGFREAVIKTGGYGLIDDSSAYHGGAEAGGRRAARGLCFAASELRSEDAVSGSAELLLSEAKDICQNERPDFLLIASGPAASMVGTDLQDTAQRIEETCKVKTLVVDVNGHRSYDYGISRTLEAIAKATAKPAAPRANAIGIIGGSALDIGEENLRGIERWCENNGLEPISTEKGFARIGEASLNLVVTRSGLEAAKWLKTEYGTDYVAGVPFGGAWSELLLRRIRTGEEPEIRAEGEKTALIIGEQLMGNALRNTLQREYGYGSVDVCSFFEMEKSLMQPGDKKLRYEDELIALFKDRKYHTVIADPLYRVCSEGKEKWVSLPCKAFLIPTAKMPLLVGREANAWLDREGRR